LIRKGGIFRATEENLIQLSHELESIQTIPKYKRILAPKLQELIKEMKNNMGQEIQGPDKVFQYVRPTPYPLKVAILVNENTASTAESVTLEARQSNKTVIIGTKTKGLADYIEVRDWGLPAYGWRLAFGLARNANIDKKDNKGLTPDVKVPKKEADWISYASEYLSKTK
jgi:C-terminal processing protease CtpA/Prc